MLSRRDLIKYGTAGGAAALVPVAAPMVGATGHGKGKVVPPAPFTVPLTVPPVLRPTARSSTTDYYEITMRHAEAEILPGVRTRVMAYNGLFPGPTIRAVSGRRTVVKQINALHHDAVVHLHGGIVAPEHDGHPTDVIAPGGSRTYVYPNRQPGATLWYHDHTHHMEAEMVFRGLAGLYIVDDRSEAALGLPSGPYDVPLLLRDARFDDRGQLVFELGTSATATSSSSTAGCSRTSGWPPASTGCGSSTAPTSATTSSGWARTRRWCRWPPTAACCPGPCRPPGSPCRRANGSTWWWTSAVILSAPGSCWRTPTPTPPTSGRSCASTRCAPPGTTAGCRNGSARCTGGAVADRASSTVSGTSPSTWTWTRSTS